MQVAARQYSQRKVQSVERIVSLAQRYPVIVVSKLHKVRGAQLIALRKKLRGQLEVVVAKNRLAALGLKRAGVQGVDEFLAGLTGQNALLFTKLSPFQLFLILEKSRVNLPARAGDVATDDVTVPAGNTGLAPGPVLSEFKEANVPTRIDTGSIWVAKDTVVARPGDVISPKLAGLLSRLGIRPIRAGVSVFLAYMEKTVLHGKDIQVDVEGYRRSFVEAIRAAVGLGVEVVYANGVTLPQLLVKAADGAKALARASGYVSKETVGTLLGRGEAQALSLSRAVKGKGYP